MEKSSYLGEVYDVFRSYFEEGKRTQTADSRWGSFERYPEFFRLLDVCEAIERLDQAIADVVVNTPEERRQALLKYLQKVVLDLVAQVPVVLTVISVCEKTFPNKVAEEVDQS